MFKELEKLRKKIDKIDRKVKKLLLKREKISKKIGIIKKELSLPIEDPEREKYVLGDTENVYVRQIYEEIIKASKDLQK